jgi:aminoglycoside phosphotransferase (APT) family kinase protein
VVRWLAQLHAAFSGQRGELLAAHPQLPVLDATWFDDWTDRALARLSTSTDTRAEALRRGLQGIDLAAELAALPATFIHGEFYPSNVMICIGGRETEVYPVDWETAAIGPAMIDLAAITSGWDELTEPRLVRAYGLHGCAERGLLLCRLHLAIRWVSWPEQWTPPREHRRDWIGSALELVERLR